MLLGAIVAVVPSFLSPTETSTSALPLSVTLYFISNIPMALSNVYKEAGFNTYGDSIDVWTMTALTSLYQTGLTFGIGLLQTLPFLSGFSDHSFSVSEIYGNLWAGFEFSLGGPGLVLLAYCVVNMGFNVIRDEGTAVIH